ncbi:twin-arginine translocase subunit TatC [Motilibacter aurantiacus]|uniref:twin-arginine translocase subunit TatC n=1 Tax=Motilibacter aurantiacus TaxID=2714955 RepID=UPI00140C98A4|nr:twin-arginine translocase subunit TatC [Motilibacter aurantiacus]NHC47327.1 twin-arginine translocase subunit TatC [Motilibacter aurantiacus]
MTLVEHLRELRSRLVKSLIAVVPGVVLGLVFYRPISDFLVEPMCKADVDRLDADSCGVLVANGLTAPFNTAIAIACVTGLLIASPVWLYQLWAFITPGLHKNERRWSIAFLCTSFPLFLAGAVVCYLVLPKAIDVLLSFTINDAQNLVDVNEYLNILLRLILVFGIAFEIPVFVAMLNAVGILPAKKLTQWWRGIVLGVFVFAAVATPTGDPFTMLALATPMLVLFVLAYFFCRWNDRRRLRSRGEPDYDNLDDDEVSPLDMRPSTIDD